MIRHLLKYQSISAFAAVLALAPIGCKTNESTGSCPNGPGIPISHISVHLITRGLTQDRTPNQAALFSRVRSLLHSLPGLLDAEGMRCPKGWSMELSVEMQHTMGRKRATATILLALQLRPPGADSPPWSYRVVGEKTYDVGPGRDTAHILIDTFARTLGDILRYPVAKHRLEKVAPDVLIGAIESGSLAREDIRVARHTKASICPLATAHSILRPGPSHTASALCPYLAKALIYPRSDFERDVTDMALRAAGRRHLSQAVPVLLTMLDAPIRVETQSAVLDALVEIADPKSVESLIRIADHKDSEDLARIVETVGRIGGPKAEEFLRFLADGHQDDTIRNMAKSTLKELHRRTAR